MKKVKGDNLTPQQFLFVEEYLLDWNATRAALAAGYAEKSARVQGSRLLQHPNVRKEIQTRLKEKVMSSDEVLARLSKYAHLDLTSYIKTWTHPETGEVKQYIDVEAMKKDGVTFLIKGIKHTNHGTYIEFHDPMKALELLGKHHALFTEKQKNDVDVTVKFDNVERILEKVYGSANYKK